LTRTPFALLACALALAACERQGDYLPKANAAPLPEPPAPAAVSALRDAIGPCERAMETASEPIGDLAARSAALPDSRDPIAAARAVCRQSAKAVQAAPVWSRLKDPCAQAVWAREGVADAALRILNGQGGALGAMALRDRIGDQVKASQRCAIEIAAAERP
jgi:hypothetical protein